MSVPQVGEETVRHQNSDVLTGVVSLSGKSLAVGPDLTSQRRLLPGALWRQSGARRSWGLFI